MAQPSFTTTAACPFILVKDTLLSGGVFSNQAMKVGYEVPAGVAGGGFAVTALFYYTADSSATSVAGAYVLYLYADCDVAPGEGSMIRMEDTGADGYSVDNFIQCACGNAQGPANLIATTTNTAYAWNNTGTAASPWGWFKVNIGGGNTRYIQLYTSVT